MVERFQDWERRKALRDGAARTRCRQWFVVMREVRSLLGLGRVTNSLDEMRTRVRWFQDTLDYFISPSSGAAIRTLRAVGGRNTASHMPMRTAGTGTGRSNNTLMASR